MGRRAITMCKIQDNMQDETMHGGTGLLLLQRVRQLQKLRKCL